MLCISRGPVSGMAHWGITLVILSEKRGFMGISNSGPSEKGSSWRVYLQVYARDFSSGVELGAVPYEVQDDL